MLLSTATEQDGHDRQEQEGLNASLVLRPKFETVGQGRSREGRVFDEEPKLESKDSSQLFSTPSPLSTSSSLYSLSSSKPSTPATSHPSPKTPSVQPTNPINLWLPTSLTRSFQTLSPRDLDDLKSQHAAIHAHLSSHPHDPRFWLTLTAIYHRLGYSDLYTSTAHKALILILAGLGIHNPHFPADALLAKSVRDAVRARLRTESGVAAKEVEDELEELHLEARQALVSGLLDCGALYEAVVAGKAAEKWFAGDGDLGYLVEEARREFLDTVRGSAAEKGAGSEKVREVSKAGRIGYVIKKEYPWLPRRLFMRSEWLLGQIQREFEEGVGNGVSNCTVQRLQSSEITEDGDVCQLGVFATRHIKKGEVVLLDQGVTSVSNILPSTRTNCDACHASLSPLHIAPSQILTPRCCSDVSFCSTSCLHNATCKTGYHRVLCGQDFRWLYDAAAKGLQGKNDISWQPLLFLRVVAVVLGGMQWPDSTHPLEHPMLARLTAGYGGNGTTAAMAGLMEWTYETHVIAPMRILAQLGVDVFVDSRWSPEVVQTIFARISNNMCSISSVTAGGGVARRCDLVGLGRKFVFFNHGCEPNVDWGKGTERTESIVVSAERRTLRAGCSTLVCRALTEVIEGEELKISYLPKTIGKEELGKWFEGGCGCGVCGGKYGKESG